MNSKTKELFYKDMYLSTFTATVLSSEKSKKGYETVLDQTLILKEAASMEIQGYINHIEVIDTYIVGNEIVHLTSSQLSVGSTVEGVINFKKDTKICSLMLRTYYFRNNKNFLVIIMLVHMK